MNRNPTYLNILKRDSLREMYRKFIEQPEVTQHYWQCDFTEVIDEQADTLLSNIEFDIINFDFQMPEYFNFKDAENSIQLHTRLNIDRVTASDLRLWAYLTHLVYPDYVKQRWLNFGRKPIDEKYFGSEADSWTDSKDIKNWESMRSSIESRFFFTGLKSNIETLNRNAISRLWWGAHLTFDAKRNQADPYELTRILFSLQSLQQALLERSLGSNPKIRRATLEFFLENPQYVKDKPAQQILKYVNLLAGPKVLAITEEQFIRGKLIEFGKSLNIE